jgi:hypothetical protein
VTTRAPQCLPAQTLPAVTQRAANELQQNRIFAELDIQQMDWAALKKKDHFRTGKGSSLCFVNGYCGFSHLETSKYIYRRSYVGTSYF